MLKSLIRVNVWNKSRALLLTIFIGCFMISTFLSLSAYGFGAIACPKSLHKTLIIPPNEDIEIFYNPSKQPFADEKNLPISSIGEVTVSPGFYRYTLRGGGVANSFLSSKEFLPSAASDSGLEVMPPDFKEVPDCLRSVIVSI